MIQATHLFNFNCKTNHLAYIYINIYQSIYHNILIHTALLSYKYYKKNCKTKKWQNIWYWLCMPTKYIPLEWMAFITHGRKIVIWSKFWALTHFSPVYNGLWKWVKEKFGGVTLMSTEKFNAFVRVFGLFHFSLNVFLNQSEEPSHHPNNVWSLLQLHPYFWIYDL